MLPAVSEPIDRSYLADLAEEFPGLRTVDKADDAFSQWIDRALRLITFGGQNAYMSRYVTTIGRTLYFPSSWSTRSAESRYLTLRHEARLIQLPIELVHLGCHDWTNGRTGSKEKIGYINLSF